MAEFCFFLPRHSGGVNEKLLKSLGIGSLDNISYSILTNIGPEGEGTFVARTAEGGGFPQEWRYDKKRQSWRRIGRVWVGLLKDERGEFALPEPKDLEHGKLSGQAWLFEIAGRTWGILPQKALPSTLGLSDTGEFEQEVAVEFRALSALVEPLFNRFLNVLESDGAAFAEACVIDEGEMSLQAQGELCVDALALTYRIGRVEAVALDLLSDEGRMRIFWGLLDAPNELKHGAEVKKN